MKKRFDEIMNSVHDASGIDEPNEYMWQEINGVYYPIADSRRYKFPRRCDITGEGMWEGYCFRNGEEYAYSKESATMIAKRDGYADLDESYFNENHYWTEWEDLDEDGWYESEHEDGTDAVWVEA